MRRYVTLFDATYAIKGQLMLESLARVANAPYEVTVVALDDRVAAMAFPHARVVPLAALEAAVPELPTARANRPWREYCWTLGSVALWWQLGQAEPGEVVTYLDADLGFFGDPERCFDELGDRSIGIVPHRFAPTYARYQESAGVFNVSWVSLRNDAIGRGCAAAWARRVLDRCDATTCGDQRYLDAWPARYGGDLCAFASPGIGVAPWNVFDYRLGDDPVVTVDGQPVIFYHYHEFAVAGPADAPRLCYEGFRLTRGYPLREVDVAVFYRDYCRRYRERSQAC